MSSGSASFAPPVSVDPLVDLVWVEVQPRSPLDVGNPALGHKPTHVPDGDAKPLGHLHDADELRGCPSIRRNKLARYLFMAHDGLGRPGTRSLAASWPGPIRVQRRHSLSRL